MEIKPAPAWQTTAWLNSAEPLTLEAQRVAEAFKDPPLAVVGLHTVFEHREAMQLPSLKAFLQEYRVRFPVGVDAPGRMCSACRTTCSWAPRSPASWPQRRPSASRQSRKLRGGYSPLRCRDAWRPPV